MASLTLWNKSCDVFWGVTTVEGFCAHCFWWPGCKGCCHVYMYGRCPDHHILLPSVPNKRPRMTLTRTHCSGFCFSHCFSWFFCAMTYAWFCKGFGVCCKALIPKPPEQCVKLPGCLLAGVQSWSWGCNHLLQWVFRYHKHKHYPHIVLGKSTVCSSSSPVPAVSTLHWCLHVTSSSCHGPPKQLYLEQCREQNAI